jgi:Xaa-Pro dipeptidase
MKRAVLGFLICSLAFALGACRGFPKASADLQIRPLKERMAIQASLNLERVDTLLLPAMRAAEIDCWIIMSREFNEDFVLDYIEDMKGATGGHRNAYIFFDDGSDRAQRIVIGTHLARESRVWDRQISYHSGQGREGPSLKPALREVIETLDPKRIGVNTSRTIPMCDGLTVAMRDFLVDAIGPEYAGRLVSAEQLIVDFLDTRLPEELEYFAEAAEITKRIHEEVFSRRAITPEASTIGDVRQYVYDRLAELGLETWYVPIIRVSREDGDFGDENTVIEPGDIVHTDIGIVYVGLYTDYQKNAYVLRAGEDEPPAGIRDAFQNSLKVQDAILHVSRAGDIGYELKEAAERLCAEWGVKARVYCHSTGVPGHGIGASINFNWPDRYGIRTTFPLRMGAIYAVESSASTAIPEWKGREIALGTEENAYLAPEGLKYFYPRQEELYLIN